MVVVVVGVVAIVCLCVCVCVWLPSVVRVFMYCTLFVCRCLRFFMFTCVLEIGFDCAMHRRQKLLDELQ